jgi:hypothetical protein
MQPAGMCACVCALHAFSMQQHVHMRQKPDGAAGLSKMEAALIPPRSDTNALCWYPCELSRMIARRMQTSIRLHLVMYQGTG